MDLTGDFLLGEVIFDPTIPPPRIQNKESLTKTEESLCFAVAEAHKKEESLTTTAEAQVKEQSVCTGGEAHVKDYVANVTEIFNDFMVSIMSHVKEYLSSIGISVSDIKNQLIAEIEEKKRMDIESIAKMKDEVLAELFNIKTMLDMKKNEPVETDGVESGGGEEDDDDIDNPDSCSSDETENFEKLSLNKVEENLFGKTLESGKVKASSSSRKADEKERKMGPGRPKNAKNKTLSKGELQKRLLALSEEKSGGAAKRKASTSTSKPKKRRM